MTSGNLQGSQQNKYPDHSHEMGLDNNIPSRNSKIPHETETKSRTMIDENASAPSTTSQQGHQHPVNPERHKNTRSQHHQGHHHKGTPKGHRAKPAPPRHRSNQILRNRAAFIVNKIISSSNAQPSRRRRNSKTFGNCYNRIKKG